MMANKKELKQFHLFVPNDSYYGAMDYDESFITLDKVIEHVKDMELSESAEIMQTAKDGSLADLCYIAAEGDRQFSCGTVYRYGSSGREVWWAKKGKGEHWEERRSIPGPVLLGGTGKKTRQWEVRSEEHGEWQARRN